MLKDLAIPLGSYTWNKNSLAEQHTAPPAGIDGMDIFFIRERIYMYEHEVGFFFGAGAEISYGMPSGGKFALNIFKRSVDTHKEQLKEALKKIDKYGAYARYWLPQGFDTKPVYAFGKSEFGSLLQSSIEYNNKYILEKLNDIDRICYNILNKNNISDDVLFSAYKNIFAKNFGETTYENTVILNKKIVNQPSNSIFNSVFYSMLLDFLIKNRLSPVKKYAVALFQLFVCVIGQRAINDLNQDFFEKNDTDLFIFDDISNLFNIDLNIIGTSILDIVLSSKITYISDKKIDNFEQFLEELFSLLLEEIFSTALDYRKLIDEHFRYLYTPQVQWAKFTKMVIFLHVAKEYISDLENNINYNAEGYYGDLNEFSKKIHINALGTSNYTNILKIILKPKIVKDCGIKYLNGNVDYFYNPYKNSVEEMHLNDNYLKSGQIVVPFILTQSGLKPLTSITMSQEYVSLYNSYTNSKAIVCIGFGFNSDDAHINGIFRQLIDCKNKHLFYVTINSDTRYIKEKLQRNIRLSSESIHNKVHVVSVDSKRNCNGILWSKYIEEQIKNI